MEIHQSGLKLRISRMFRSSFRSCKSREMSDIIERPDLVPHNRRHYQLVELFSPKPRPFPTICRPKCGETAESDLFPRSKVSDRSSLLNGEGRKCPPATPICPKETKMKERRKARKKTMKRCKFESFDDYYDWFDSDDDDDDERTLFSSRSLSSDSSDSFRRNKPRRRRKKEKEVTETGGKVKESFAVVKRSSDPRNDFRTSMVEMIVEKQIFGARDLENLLQTFLSLNSFHHHRVIIEVFMEIWEALYS